MDNSKTLHQGAFIPSRHISRNIILFWVLSSYILLTIFLCAINWLPPFLIAQGKSSGTTQSNSIHIKLYRRQRFFYPGTPYKPSESEVIFSGESYLIRWTRPISEPFPEQGVPPINISLWLSGEKIQSIEYNFVTTAFEYLWGVAPWVKPEKDYVISISFDDSEGGLVRYGYGFEIARRVAGHSAPAATRTPSLSTNDMSLRNSQLGQGSNTNTPPIPSIVGASVGGTVGFVLIGVLLFLYIKERRKRRTTHPGFAGGDDRLSDRTFHLNKFLASLRPGVPPAGDAPSTEGNGSTIRRSSPDMDDRTISEFRSVSGASNKSRPMR